MKKANFLSLDSLSLQDFDENSELIPLMTPEDEEEIRKEDLPKSLPILSLRNTVLFPGVVIPITAGRDKSIKLINDANNGSKVVGVVSQKDESVEDPTGKDLHKTGTVARILKVLKMPDGNTTVIIQGKKLKGILHKNRHFYLDKTHADVITICYGAWVITSITFTFTEVVGTGLLSYGLIFLSMGLTIFNFTTFTHSHITENHRATEEHIIKGYSMF